MSFTLTSDYQKTIGFNRYWMLKLSGMYALVSASGLWLKYRGNNYTPTTYSASSTWGGLPIDNLWDGNINTMWSSANGITTAFLYLDFGRVLPFDTLEIIARNDGQTLAQQHSPINIELYTSEDDIIFRHKCSFIPAAWTQGSTQTFSLPV